MYDSSFSVKTDVFEGPLELLLRLIEKRKLFINDVSLSQVTDDYMRYVERLSGLPVHDTAQFIVISSTLLLIKSRSLLPGITLTEEEQADIEELEDRLKLYKKTVELSRNIKELFGRDVIFMPQAAARSTEPIFTPDKRITLENIRAAIHGIVEQFPEPQKLTKAVVKKVISLEEAINNLTERIKSSLKMSFGEFSKSVSGKESKEEVKEKKVAVIMGFLAMLELVKRGIIAAKQEENFKDIEMEHSSG